MKRFIFSIYLLYIVSVISLLAIFTALPFTDYIIASNQLVLASELNQGGEDTAKAYEQLINVDK